MIDNTPVISSSLRHSRTWLMFLFASSKDTGKKFITSKRNCGTATLWPIFSIKCPSQCDINYANFCDVQKCVSPREMLCNSSFTKRFIIARESFALNYGLHNRPRLDMTIIFCSRLALCCFRIANCCFLADKLWMATGNSFWIIFVNEFSSQLVAVSTHAAPGRDFSEWIADTRFSWFRNA